MVLIMIWKHNTSIGMVFRFSNFAQGFCLLMEGTWHSSRENMTTPSTQAFSLQSDRGLPLYSPMPEPASRYFAFIPLIRMKYSGMDSGYPTVKDLLLGSGIRQTMDEVHMRLYAFTLNQTLSN